ncbi:Nn.00g063320.m01.CDS01 [Neocucurbitaria sp. VM-36]
MADPNAPTPSTGLFSRRPSFFGPKSNKAHKPSPLNLPPASNPELDTPPLVPNQYHFPPRVPTTPHQRRQTSRHSIAASVTDLGAQLRPSRSASLRTNTSAGTAGSASTEGGSLGVRLGSSSSHKPTPSATMALTYSPEKAPANVSSRPALSISTFSRNKQKSSENVRPDGGPVYEKSPLSAVDKPKTPFGMAVPMPLRHPPTQKEILQANQQANRGLGPAAPIPVPNGSNPHIIFQHIQELASKRISTLDYLRKAHEGRIYWFNTLLFAKADLTRLPSFNPRNASRRATHYLLLGFSLPTILDLNANSATDYLKALNALLLEFEQYQSIHPTDGSTPSSLSRARLPQMFKRANLNMGSKGRRSSSAAGDFPMLTPSNSFSGDLASMESPPNDDLLLPNESYTHLQTPSLPFDPDFFSTFATLCDVLIDCYTKILSMLSTPESVSSAGAGVPSMVGDLFNKADARVRKIILAGVVREFEESCRAGLKSEVGGVGKVVLGGLM